jgi:hypothetical protein
VGELYGPNRFHRAAYQGKITYDMELIPMGPLDLSEKKATICYLAGHYGLGLVEAGDVDQLMEFVEERRGSARSVSP